MSSGSPSTGSIALIDADGNPTTSLLFEAKGTYTLTLAPAPAGANGFVGALDAGTVPNPSAQPGQAIVTFTGCWASTASCRRSRTW